MTRLIQRALVGAALTVALALVASCDKEPVDATRQVDDFPVPSKPIDRLKPIGSRAFGRCSAQQIRQRLAEYKNPEMMALGGSVFNGISSMQINWWLADWSPPAQVARALHGGITDGPVPRFRVPPYPHYGRDPYGNGAEENQTFRLGLDIETFGLGRIETAVRRQGRLMNWFQGHSAKAAPVADNISFGGAAIEDILYGTARDYNRRLAAVRRATSFPPDRDKFWDPAPVPRTYAQIMEHATRVNGLTDVAKTAAALTTVFFAQNSSFVLNPTRDECLDELTPLDQVLFRQPKRLLVGVGANSGLFTFLYAGHPIDKQCGNVSFSFGEEVREWKRYVSIKQTSRDEFLTDMKVLLDKLSTEGKDIEHIYVMGQLRPRMVANLKPAPGQGRPGPDADYPPGQVKIEPGFGSYYDKYVLDFAPEGSGRWLSGREVDAADKLNKEVNDELKRIVEAYNTVDHHGNPKKPRFAFVDLQPLAQKYDFTHNGREGHDGDRIEVTNEHLPELGKRVIRLDNRVLTFSRDEERLDNGEVIGQRILKGGIFSIDNLHPTVVGYAMLATSLLEVIQQTEGIEISKEVWKAISPQMAYARSFKTKENGKEVNKNGNVLRRLDKGLAGREGWLQAMFDLGARGLDCWSRQGDVR